MTTSSDSSSSDTTSSSSLQQNPSSQIPDAVRVGTKELVLSPTVSNPEEKDERSEAGEVAKSQFFCSGGDGIIDRMGEGKNESAWKKSSSGPVDVVGTVMGEISWPDLSMAAEVNVSRRSSSADSLKNVSGVAVPISSTLPLNSELTSLKNIPRGSSYHNSFSNNVGFPRQKYLKSGGRTGPPEMSDLMERPPLVAEQHLPPPPPPGAFLKVNSRRLANGPRLAPTYHNYGLKDQNYQPRSSKNYGSNPRRSFGYHNTNGAGRYQDRHRYQLNPLQPFYIPDAQMLQPYHQSTIFRAHLQSPPRPPTLTSPQNLFSYRPPVPSFGYPYFLSEVHPQMYGMFAPPQPPLEAYRYMPVPGKYAPYATQTDADLRTAIVIQIEFYFSEENLNNDSYLKNLMGPFGWVPISIIAGFNKMKKLTDDIQLISDSLQSSATVEVQGDKMRCRNDWMRWLPPPATPLENHLAPSPVFPEPRGDQYLSTTDSANGACAEAEADQSTT